MTPNYRTFFGMTQEAFPNDLNLNEVLETEDIAAIGERLTYTLRLGAVATITGDVGSGKSTALRYLVSKLHPAEYRIIWLTACSGSILEFYRLLLAEMGIYKAGSQRALLIRLIKKSVSEIVFEKKMKPVLIIDEAGLMRLEVFTELHTVTLFERDSNPWLPIILAGQSNLIDKLMYQTSLPLASRVVARSHLEPVERREMERYLIHHLSIAGVKTNLFEEQAVTAIHQGAGGLFRKANHLARGALVAAAGSQSSMVNADHVRLAATELF
jgi:general secretion pathway protein A